MSYDEIFFDCDSTLSTIEGIDELARLKGVEERIVALTNAAMNGLIPLQEVYAERLRLLRPTRADMHAIEQAYKRTLVPDARETIATLHKLGRCCFVVSGGLADAVIGFAEWLGIPRKYVHAVGLSYNQLSGRWWDYQACAEGNPDESYLMYDDGPLTKQHGKAEVITAARTPLAKGKAAMLVGDGSSDLAAQSAVDLFCGFGGVVARTMVATQSPAFIGVNSLAPVLLLALAEHEGDHMPTKQKAREMLAHNPDALRIGPPTHNQA